MNVIARVFKRIASPKVTSGGLILLSGLCATLTWAAQNGLQAVSVSKGKDDTQIVKIQFKQDVSSEPVTFTTSNPNRLVLDFADTSNAMGRGTEELNTGAIRNYQAVQSGDRTRLVINLTGPANYEVRREKNMVYAVLQASGRDTQRAATTRTSPAAPLTTHTVRDVEFKRGKNGEGRIIMTLSAPGAALDIQQKGNAVQVDILNTQLPSPLQRRLDVSDFATPAQLVETFQQNSATRLRVTPKGKWDYYAYQTGDQVIVEIRSLEGSQAIADRPVWSGEKLSLNFQNVDVRAVLQVIADFTGLNIIASDTVTGNVTLRLKDVPWDQALDIIMRSKGLDKRMSGNVIWIAPRDELTAKEKAELEAKKAREELETLVTQSYPLNYIRADEALAVVSGLPRSLVKGREEDATCSPSASGIKAETTANSDQSNLLGQQGGRGTARNINRVLSERGGASYDLTTNTLIVTDTLERHEAVIKVLQSVDVPARQVMIEARIVLADDKFSRELGARLGFQGSDKRGNTQYGLGTYESSGAGATTGITPGAPDLNVNLGAGKIGTPGKLGFTIFNAKTAAILGLELQALEADNRGKIVSNPRVVTTNLRPAVILQGKQIPVVTPGTSTQPATTTFKDALLCLLVSPQVLNNDDVILNVEVTKDEEGTRYGDNVAINAKRIRTQVRVSNGDTAVLGGIFEQTQRNDTEKVPFLGDLPILGHLFKTNYKNDDKTEMLIFLTPRILDEANLAFGGPR